MLADYTVNPTPSQKSPDSSFSDILVSRYGSGPLIICKSEGIIPLFFIKLISLINTHLLSRLQDLSVIQWETQQRSAPSVLWSTVQHVHSRADGCFVVCPLCFKCDEFAYVLSEMHFQDFFFLCVCMFSSHFKEDEDLLVIKNNINPHSTKGHCYSNTSSKRNKVSSKDKPSDVIYVGQYFYQSFCLSVTFRLFYTCLNILGSLVCCQ